MEHIDAMRLALEQARAALALGDVPVGAVVLHDGNVIAARHNERELRQDPTAHAEVLALRDASEALGRWRLEDCTLVVTLEPCVMCAGALFWSQISRVVYAAKDPKRGYSLLGKSILHPKTIIEDGLLKEEAAQLMEDFFKQKR